MSEILTVWRVIDNRHTILSRLSPCILVPHPQVLTQIYQGGPFIKQANFPLSPELIRLYFDGLNTGQIILGSIFPDPGRIRIYNIGKIGEGNPGQFPDNAILIDASPAGPLRDGF